jgi:hypothetical protein
MSRATPFDVGQGVVSLSNHGRREQRAVEMAAAWTRQTRALAPPWKSRAEREISTFPRAHHHQPEERDISVEA